jgi:hypothetical protein
MKYIWYSDKVYLEYMKFICLPSMPHNISNMQKTYEYWLSMSKSRQGNPTQVKKLLLGINHTFFVAGTFGH